MMTTGLAVFVIAASTAKLGADANTKTNGSNIFINFIVFLSEK